MMKRCLLHWVIVALIGAKGFGGLAQEVDDVFEFDAIAVQVHADDAEANAVADAEAVAVEEAAKDKVVVKAKTAKKSC